MATKHGTRTPQGKLSVLWLVVFAVILATPHALFAQPAATTATPREPDEGKFGTLPVGEHDAALPQPEYGTGLVWPRGWERMARWVSFPTERETLPNRFDWRDYVVLPPVRNQGGCGSCWAFSTLGALECIIKIKEGINVDLSEQWLVSCNQEGWGCLGGWFAHDYLQWKTDPCGGTGAVIESEFPYVGWDASCECPYAHEYLIDDWGYISGGTNAIKQAIMEYGPVSVVVASSGFSWYSGGIYDNCSADTVDHGVVLVGWDDSQGENGVWFARNSWGESWGEDGGYMRIPYGCSHVADVAVYADYAAAVPLEWLTFTYPTGLPTTLLPDEETRIRVDVSPALGTPVPGTGWVHYRLNSAEEWVGEAMDVVGTNQYEAVLPATSCGATVRYYFSAQTWFGLVCTDPTDALDAVYAAPVAPGLQLVLSDDFEADQGWTVETCADLEDGAWERGTPVGGGDRGDPPSDYDGSGQCFLTGNQDGDSDVDGGYTWLISPTIDLSTGGGPFDFLGGKVHYALSYTNHWEDTSSGEGSFGGVYSLDDGTIEYGVRADGTYTAWLNHFTTVSGAETITYLDVVFWNTAVGQPATLYVWDDANGDGNPSDALVLSSHSLMVEEDMAVSGVPARIDIPDTVVGPSFFVGVVVDTALDGSDFPAGYDTDEPVVAGASWLIGANQPVDPNDLSHDAVEFQLAEATLPPGNWVVRAVPPFEGDLFKTYVSNDDGASWVLAEVVGPSTIDGWAAHEFVIGDYVVPSDQVKVRFEIADLDTWSVVEGGIDDFRVTAYDCAGYFVDCNGNSIPDVCDLTCAGECSSYPGCERDSDCHGDGIPDSCQIEGNDCNSNSVPDECDIALGISQDLNGNDLPDECEDCNNNGFPDEWDVDPSDPDGNGEVSADCQVDGAPDECQLDGNDCNADGIPDDCQLGTRIDPLEYRIDDVGIASRWGIEQIGFIAWMNQFTVLPGAEIAYALKFTYGNLPVGEPVTVYLWSDPDNDGNPSDAQVLAAVETSVSAYSTWCTVPIPETYIGPAGTSFFAGAIAHQQDDQRPVTVDSVTQVQRTWIVARLDGPIDPNELSAGVVYLGLMDDYCIPPGWALPGTALIRATGYSGASTNDLNGNGIPDECEEVLPGDLDDDGDVDVEDFAIFTDCMNGPDDPYPLDCNAADLDTNGDVDIADFAVFQTLFGGD